MNKVTLNEKKYPIRFTYSVISRIEQDTGKNYLNFDPEKMTIGDCISMAYHGCRKADESFSMTKEEIGDACDVETLIEVAGAFAEDLVRPSKKK